MKHREESHSTRAGHELLMAVVESTRRRARVDLPLTVTESPLEATIASGEV